jgi:dTMP kinase
MFFSLDGPDGVGKSTQLPLFCGWLRDCGLEVVACRDPGSTALGDAVRSILLGHHGAPISRSAEMLLYMAARAQLVSEVIRPALAAGKAVVSDRYLLANIVYQGHAGGIDPELIREVGRIATEELSPTLTFVLDMPPESAAGRLTRPLDRMESQGDEYRRRLRAGYLAEAARDPRRIVVIDAARPIDEVQQSLREAAAPCLAAGRHFTGDRT